MAMTQHYMDEQIFDEILDVFFGEGTPLPWTRMAFYESDTLMKRGNPVGA